MNTTFTRQFVATQLKMYRSLGKAAQLQQELMQIPTAAIIQTVSSHRHRRITFRNNSNWKVYVSI